MKSVPFGQLLRRFRSVGGHFVRTVSKRANSVSSGTSADVATAITLTYRQVLGREPEPIMLAERVDAVAAGMPFMQMFVEIATSEEARCRAAAVDRSLAKKAVIDDATYRLWRTIITSAYRHVLRRTPGSSEIDGWVQQLSSGLGAEGLFESILASDEAATFVRDSANDATPEGPDQRELELWRALITITYRQVLRRTPREAECEEWLVHLTNGLSTERFVASILQSDEAAIVSDGSPLRSMQLAPSKSDGEFLVSTSRNLFGRGVTPPEVVFWQNVLGEEVERRVDFAINMINDQIAKRDGAADVDLVHDASTCSILGSRRTISKRGWDERRRALSSMTKRSEMGTSMSTPARPTSFEHSGTFKVSMIASLYKGDRFIRPFLENITSLNAFDTAELIIIDANSPENELAVIEEYQALFPNIVYRRINYRISIYEAWNLGVEIARGEYLTNTNLDDVRRSDSIALQAAMLDRNSDVDVVYQDFYYSFEPNLRFEEIAAVGFRSDLPIVTPQNLLLFNSPHNAPMWRARLHEEIGMFDTRYRSAGDHEFWVRCLASRKKFRKINSPHIGYFQNPEGVSTRPNTRGIEEGRDIQTRYCAKLIPSALLQSRRDFRRSLRIGEIDDHLPDNTPYYDVAQAALETLGVRRLSVASSPSRCDDAGADVGREGHVTPCAS